MVTSCVVRLPALAVGCALAAAFVAVPIRAQTPAADPGVSLWSVKPGIGEGLELAGAPEIRRAQEPLPPVPGVDPAATPRKRFEFVVAPLPLINPTLDNGLALVVGALYPLQLSDLRSPPSGTMLFGMKTSNGSWGIGGAQMLHFDQDRFRALVAAGYADVNFDFFGIGSSAGDAGQSILLNQAGAGGLAEVLVRTVGRLYAGARYRLMQTVVHGDFDQTIVEIPLPDIDLRTALLGPHVQFDTRDNQFAPTRGVLVDVQALFAGERLGGARTYQVSQGAFSTFVSLSDRQVLAGRVNVCGASDDAPFYDLCLIGQYQDLRGYPAGQYRDRRLISGQAEYRLRFWRRFGLVLFGGGGEVAPAFGDLTWDDVLPSGGGGLRFRLTRENPVNLRVDYAWGRRSHALYISVGEAF